MVTAMVFAAGILFGAAAGVWRSPSELEMRPLVVRATAPTEFADCKRVPLRNGRVGETVVMCESRGAR